MVPSWGLGLGLGVGVGVGAGRSCRVRKIMVVPGAKWSLIRGLGHMRLQGGPHRAAGWTACGCRARHIGLQGGA